MKHRSRFVMTGRLARAMADFIFALIVIWLVSLCTATHHGVTFLLFSLSVASITTLDLALLRHLRRVYASPRRGVWRRT